MRNKIFNLLDEYIAVMPYCELLKVDLSYPISFKINDTKIEIYNNRNGHKDRECILYIFGKEYASTDYNWFHDFSDFINKRMKDFEDDMIANIELEIEKKISCFKYGGSDM